jgi:nitrate/TMAO reductase-like tetraheme cytochrome c subunit
VVAVLTIGAAACFMLRLAFRILFRMTSAFFRMLCHENSPAQQEFEERVFFFIV